MFEKERDKRHNICNIAFAGYQNFMDMISESASNAEQEITPEKA